MALSIQIAIIFALINASIFFINCLIFKLFDHKINQKLSTVLLIFSIILIIFTLSIYFKITTYNYKKSDKKAAKYLFYFNLILAILSTIVVIPWYFLFKLIQDTIADLKRQKEEKKALKAAEEEKRKKSSKTSKTQTQQMYGYWDQTQTQWIKKIANIGYAVKKWDDEYLRAMFKEIDKNNHDQIHAFLLPTLIYRIFEEYNRIEKNDENAQIDSFETISKLITSISNEAIMIINKAQNTPKSQIITINDFVTFIADCLIQIGNQPKYRQIQ